MEVFVILVIAGIFLTLFGFVSLAAIASGFPRGILGVCQRLSEQFNLSVGGLRVLFVLATLFTGIVPGVIAYVALALFNGSLDEASAARRPSPNGADGSQLLGICADLADRLDVVPAERLELAIDGPQAAGLALEGEPPNPHPARVLNRGRMHAGM